ncbi:MAG: CRISPR-associated helicase Cas3', partial [Desulfobaccales bacterium]
NMIYAHSANGGGEKHCLKQHLQEVAHLAKKFADKFQAGPWGCLAGLLHDVGKINPAFQDYLDGKTIRGPDHSSAGAVLAGRRNYWDCLAFLLVGHHGGLPSFPDLKQRLQEKSSEPAILEVCRKAEHLVTLPEPPPLPPLTSSLQVELFLRMLFSTLVDADFLDTERHFNPEKSEVREKPYDPAALVRLLRADQRRKFAEVEPNALNLARHEIYQACLEAAARPPGIFRLTVPTGGGKTRSGLAFALEHAVRHRKHRVIVALPYTSIIDQTAQVYRDILGDEYVLEHHSAVMPSESDADFLQDQWARLAAENWDAPIIVTTTVQLFESLLAHKPAACRKLHNLAQSIIILDEVQTLPTPLLAPILDVLQQLVDRYGVTLVLSTATQPALTDADSPYLKGLKGEIREIVPDPARYFQALKRVTYERPLEAWPWERLAQEMRRAPQCLAVVNTKTDALALLDALDDPESLHLSTCLCMAHRREVIAEIKNRLNPEKPRLCRVVATQVVEAGVDLDFPLVLRALGPLDRIVQAAGRCNREGRLAPEQARVIIFRPEAGKMPQESYRSGSDIAASMLNRADVDLHAPAIYEAYFRQLYQVVNTDEKKINELRVHLNFPEVAARFRLIENDSVPLVVRWPRENSPVEGLLAQLQTQGGVKGGEGRLLLRRLQPYLVNVRRRVLDDYQRQGLVRELPLGLWEWLGNYHEVRGLCDKAIDPESLVI